MLKEMVKKKVRTARKVKRKMPEHSYEVGWDTAKEKNLEGFYEGTSVKDVKRQVERKYGKVKNFWTRRMLVE